MPPTFSDLGVPAEICSALDQRGITTPFEIQAATIADALAGRDVCGRAPTGSGKTLAFGIPLVAGVDRSRPGHPQALVLAPTRELAEQIMAELTTIAGRVRVGVVYGGVGYGGQISALRRGVDLLVACPGRLEDLISQGLVHLDEVHRVVIDEADRMADMGFMPVVRRLLEQTGSPRQTVLFSATLDGDVAQLTADHQRNPVRHEVGEETPDVTAADHVFWRTGKTNRTELTVEAVNAVWPAIVFSRTRHGSDRLARQLTQQGIATAAIHGGRSQSQRNKALADFAHGKVQALVATDVAARGIHVDGVAAVIHYDPPEDHKTYIHRSGRTARAGKGGVILSLVQPDQVKDTTRLQRHVGLNEPLVEPDAAALRALSDVASPIAGARRPVPPVPAPEPEMRSGPPRNGRDRDGRDNRSSRSNGRGERAERSDLPARSDRPARAGDDDRRSGRHDQAAADRGDRSDRSDRSDRPARSGQEPAAAASDGPRPRRSGLNLTTRSRAGRPGGASTSSNGRGGADGSARPGARSGGTAGSRPAKAGAKPGARSKAGAASGKPGRSAAQPSTGKPASNRKARRAHLQWQ